MSISYEATGRTKQKARTRAALLDAARALLSEGRTPTVEEAAEAAAISRATAYRYFPNQGELLVAAHPEIEATTLLGEDAPADPEARLERTVGELIRLTISTEPDFGPCFAFLWSPLLPTTSCFARAVRSAGSRMRWPPCAID